MRSMEPSRNSEAFTCASRSVTELQMHFDRDKQVTVPLGMWLATVADPF